MLTKMDMDFFMSQQGDCEAGSYFPGEITRAQITGSNF